MGSDPGLHAAAQPIIAAVEAAARGLGPVESRRSKSQLGFYRKHPFAAVWEPGRYLRGGRTPVVLSVYLRRRDGSPRWKEVVEPRAGRFTHHLELRSPAEIDSEVRAWLAEAWALAG